MPSKGVVDRQRIGQSIIAAARTHAQQVGEQLQLELGEIVEEGETLPDFVDLQLQLARYLEMRLNILVAADEAHLEELDDDQDPRLRRDEAAEALYQKVIEVREAMLGVFGSTRADALLGISGRTARDPLFLLRQAARVLERLREPAPDLPPRRLNGLVLDRNALADELQPAVESLAAALQDVDRERRETETTKGFKDEALEAFDVSAGGVARMLIGCDEIAGFPNFAERIRLTLPNRRGTISTPDPSPPEGGTPSGEQPPEGAEPETDPGEAPPTPPPEEDSSPAEEPEVVV